MSPRPPLPQSPGRPACPLRRRLLAGMTAAAVATILCVPAQADSIPVLSAELRLEEDRIELFAEFALAFTPTLEEALQRGVPLYFVQEFELARPRWYWFDEKVVQNATTYRVSYTPLTRQYRVSSGLLGQTFDTLEEVQRVIGRISARTVARPDQLERGARYDASVRVRLDVNQLPKPFQVNALASREWQLASDWYRWGWSYSP